MRCYRNRVQPFGIAGSPNLNMIGLIVVPFQLVVLLHILPRYRDNTEDGTVVKTAIFGLNALT